MISKRLIIAFLVTQTTHTTSHNQNDDVQNRILQPFPDDGVNFWIFSFWMDINVQHMAVHSLTTARTTTNEPAKVYKISDQ